MLNKEQRQQAENMRAELAPIYAKAAKLASVWQKKAQEERIAEQFARVWQYRGQDLRYCDSLPEEQKQEEAQKAAQTYEESRQKWHDELYKKYQAQSTAENAERAAWFNYKNYLYFICEIVADKLRPYAAELYKAKGDNFKKWAEIIEPKRSKEYSPKNIYIFLYLDSSFSDSFCLNVEAFSSGTCGASHYYYYKKEPEQEKGSTQEPRQMTATQYEKRKKILENYTEKAKALRAEQVEKAKEWGMLDACEILKYPSTEKYR